MTGCASTFVSALVCAIGLWGIPDVSEARRESAQPPFDLSGVWMLNANGYQFSLELVDAGGAVNGTLNARNSGDARTTIAGRVGRDGSITFRRGNQCFRGQLFMSREPYREMAGYFSTDGSCREDYGWYAVRERNSPPTATSGEMIRVDRAGQELIRPPGPVRVVADVSQVRELRVGRQAANWRMGSEDGRFEVNLPAISGEGGTAELFVEVILSRGAMLDRVQLSDARGAVDLDRSRPTGTTWKLGRVPSGRMTLQIVIRAPQSIDRLPSDPPISWTAEFKRVEVQVSR